MKILGLVLLVVIGINKINNITNFLKSGKELVTNWM